MSKKMESKNVWRKLMKIVENATNLRKCILVQLGPTINPNSDDNKSVYEMFSFRRNVHHTPFCSAVVPLILDVTQLSTLTAIYDWGLGRKLYVSCDSQARTCIQQHYRVQEMMAVRRGGRVESFSAKKCCRERMIFVCCVCVVWRKVADFQRSLLGLSRDLSHLQQRTRHFVHFSSVTWPRNFHHCIMRVAESLSTSGIFLLQRTFSQSMFPSLLFRFSVFHA